MTLATNVERMRGIEAKPIEDGDVIDSQISSNIDALSFVNSPDPHRDGQEDEDNTEYNV